MSSETQAPMKAPRRTRSVQTLIARGDPMVFLTGGALAVCLAMVVALVAFVIYRGVATFWPSAVHQLELADGTLYVGEKTREESFDLTPQFFKSEPPLVRARLREELFGKDAAPLQLDRAFVTRLTDEDRAAWERKLSVSFEGEGEIALALKTFLGLEQADRLVISKNLVEGSSRPRDDPDASLPATFRKTLQRRQFRTENFEMTDSHAHWVRDVDVVAESYPEWALTLERIKDGRFYGFLEGVLRYRPWNANVDEADAVLKSTPDAQVIVERYETKEHVVQDLKALDLHANDEILYLILDRTEGPEAAWETFEKEHPGVRDRYAKMVRLKKVDIGRVSAEREASRLGLVEVALDHGEASQEYLRAKDEHEALSKELENRSREAEARIAELDAENRTHGLWMRISDGRHKLVEFVDIVRGYPANRLSFGEKLSVYFSRWHEFLTDDPRAANSEGGVLPAIFGTVVMTLLLCIAVVPFGVLAALYLREYAKQGPIVSAVRIAVNNLAGVPSIVFGVFGLGFFCYGVGKYIDGGPQAGLGLTVFTPAQWMTGLIGLLILLAGLFWLTRFTWSAKARANPRAGNLAKRVAAVLWLGAVALVACLILFTPHFGGFYRASLSEDQPTYGQSGLLWAALTLALLTLPVVIVATEEALAAVPSSMREGSYACGASKWQTIRRIVLPRAMPGIMTGMILAMARGAGEVAPIMLVGVAKKASQLAVDGIFPYVHPERSFMHLGFHIYDVGFQSQNSLAAVPMVFTTTLLLIAIIAGLNLTAILLRSRLRRKFVGSQF